MEIETKISIIIIGFLIVFASVMTYNKMRGEPEQNQTDESRLFEKDLDLTLNWSISLDPLIIVSCNATKGMDVNWSIEYDDYKIRRTFKEVCELLNNNQGRTNEENN